MFVCYLDECLDFRHYCRGTGMSKILVETSLYGGHNLHCKFLPHENYGDWELQGPCRGNPRYLWKRAVRIRRKTHDNYRTYNHHRVSSQLLQPFSIHSADFPCRDPAIPSPRTFYGQNICSQIHNYRQFILAKL